MEDQTHAALLRFQLQQLKVNEQQLAGLIKCDVSLADYIEILKSKGIIALDAEPPSQ